MDMQAHEQNSSPTISEQRFTFTGTGAEYFRIWIVNLILTILTLGIFSAWAKVRRLQYFYRNTHIGDASFDYHGSPVAILKGRLIGVALFGLYSATIQFVPVVGVLVLIGIYLLMPFFLAMSLRFRLYNTSFRGLRFGFAGSVKEAYLVFLALPFATFFTGYLLAPFTHHRIKAYQHGNTRFGQTNFSFDASIGGFYLIYLFAFLQYMGITMTFVIAGVVGAVLFKDNLSDMMNENQAILAAVIGVYALIIVAMLVVIPYFTSRIENIIWNGTRIAGNSIKSKVSARKLAWIMISNFFATVLTLGLFKPFAAIRMAKYRTECMTLVSAGEMHEFIASEQQKAGATGMETAEVFDVDLGF